jgi:hypothetical protein
MVICRILHHAFLYSIQTIINPSLTVQSFPVISNRHLFPSRRVSLTVRVHGGSGVAAMAVIGFMQYIWHGWAIPFFLAMEHSRQLLPSPVRRCEEEKPGGEIYFHLTNS